MVAMFERAARDPSVDVDKMERLFALRERMIALYKQTAYNAALALVQAKLKPVFRDAVNNATSSTYARLETISDAINPIVTEEGFSLSFDTRIVRSTIISASSAMSCTAQGTRCRSILTWRSMGWA